MRSCSHVELDHGWWIPLSAAPGNISSGLIAGPGKALSTSQSLVSQFAREPHIYLRQRQFLVASLPIISRLSTTKEQAVCDLSGSESDDDPNDYPKAASRTYGLQMPYTRCQFIGQVVSRSEKLQNFIYRLNTYFIRMVYKLNQTRLQCCTYR